jgi:hypothetical protein
MIYYYFDELRASKVYRRLYGPQSQSGAGKEQNRTAPAGILTQVVHIFHTESFY